MTGVKVFQALRTPMRTHLATANFEGSFSTAEGSKVSYDRSTLGDQTLPLVIQHVDSRSTLLQAEVLWNKDASMYTDDSDSFQLHHAVSILLAGSKRGQGVEMGRNSSANVRRARSYRRKLH